MTVATQAEPAYRVFETTVRAVKSLTPSFLQFTVAGADLDAFDDCGDDQRFKLVLPLPADGGTDPTDAFADFPRTHDWYADWRVLPTRLRNPIRTYTVAAVRPSAREVDFVVVRHGATGPASAWAEIARPGDPVLLVGPNARCATPQRAAEWAPPRGADLLVAGDETAVPAVLSVLAGLAADRRGVVLLEIPTTADALPVRAPAGVEVRWLGRDGRRHGSLLEAAVRSVTPTLTRAAPTPTGLSAPDDDRRAADDDSSGADLPWGVASDSAAPIYAWLAGEAGVIKALRRHLVGERGIDRRAVTFMGYWKRGAAEQI